MVRVSVGDTGARASYIDCSHSIPSVNSRTQATTLTVSNESMDSILMEKYESKKKTDLHDEKMYL